VFSYQWMFSYQCGNCGAYWTVAAVCFDCPFCHCMFYQRQRYAPLYETRLTNGTATNPSASNEEPK
jgi:hypothetical protein